MKLLQGKEFRTWRMTMAEYLDQIDKTKDDALVKELNTLAMRSRISRLDKLYGDTLKELHKMGGKVNKSMENHLANAYKDNYYKNSYDIGQKASLNASFAEVDSAKIKKVLNNPWSGKNYSQRIWKNTDKLSKLIKNEVVNGIHRGVSVNKMAKLVQQRMDVGRYEATRLVRTEMNYVQNQAAKDSIKSSGMKYYIFLATLDRRTSSICRAHDRKVYPIDEAQAGTNMPPLHPNCRSTIAGSVKEFDTGRGKRVGRDGDGNRIYVPAAMKYDDFYKIYVEKSQTLAQWEKSNKPKINKMQKNGVSVTDILTPDIEKYQIEVIGKEFSKQLEKLTEEEKRAITGYTGFGAERINSAIMGKRKINDSIRKEIRLIDSALAKGIIPEDMRVVRKTIFPFIEGLPSKKDLNVDEMKSCIGKPLTNKIFTSTTLKNIVHLGRNVCIILDVMNCQVKCNTLIYLKII